MAVHHARVPRALLAGVLLAIVGCSDGAPPEGPPGPLAGSNLLLIVVDTLRADHLGAYGGLVRTPHLDRLARRGATFREARSQIPITGPSHASLFTGRLPVDHGVHNNAQPLDDRFATLAEQLRAAGLATAGVVSLGVLQARFGFARGFDDYFDRFAAADWWRTADEVNADAVPWLRAHGARPFFLWVHYSDPHSPYAPPGTALPVVELQAEGAGPRTFPADGRFRSFPLDLRPGENAVRMVGADGVPDARFVIGDLRAQGSASAAGDPAGWDEARSRWGAEHEGRLPARIVVRSDEGGPATVSFRLTESLGPDEVRRRYAAEVEHVDGRIGELLREVDALGLRERTLVIVTSDHGEGLADHGEIGHVDQLYESQLRVPLIVRMPGLGPLLVSGRAARLVDVAPTVRDLLGVPGGPGPRARSLAPLLRGQALAPGPSVAFTFRPEAREDLVAVTEGARKLIRNVAAGTEESYSLRDDPGERSPRDPGPADERLRATLAREATGDARPAPADLSEEDRERLRGLGYVR